jgi:hypothetical protein
VTSSDDLVTHASLCSDKSMYLFPFPSTHPSVSSADTSP